MDTGERLAAYLAGDLDTAEARRLEGELARDPALRARLARLRRLEDALGDLPAVEVPTVFSERLRGAVQRELDGLPVAGEDELAARRARRSWGGLPAWLPAAAGAAAVLVAVVAVGVSLSGVGGGNDSADEAAMGTLETEAADGGAAFDTGEAMRAPADAPVVVDEGAVYDAESVQALAGDDVLVTAAGRSLTDEAATETAERYRAALRATASDGDAAEEEAPAEGDDTAAGGTTQMAPPPPELRGDVDEADLDAVRSCLEGLLPTGGEAIPAYAEVATFDGEDAIVYGVLTRDPETDAFTRVELWVVARDDCEVLFYAQQDDAG